MTLRILAASFLWLMGALFFYGTAVIPCFYFIQWGRRLPFPAVVFVCPLAVFLFMIALMLVTGICKRLFLPRPREGHFSFSSDREALVWKTNNLLTQYFLVIFHRMLNLNATLRYLTLRLYGADIHFTSFITTMTYLRDYDLIKIGRHCLIGAWAMIHGHFHNAVDSLVLARTEIGDNSFLGAYTWISCGCKIGNAVFTGIYVSIGTFSIIGNNCRIDYKTRIGNNAAIEDEVTVGKYCSLGNCVHVGKGIIIPDFSFIPDNTIISSQEMVAAFVRYGYSFNHTTAVQSH